MMDWIKFYNVFLSNKEIFFRFKDIIPKEIFVAGVLTNIFILVTQFAEKYKRMPDFDTLELILDNLPDSERENKKEYLQTVNKIRNAVSTVEPDVFAVQLTKAIETFMLEKFILKAANQISTITWEEMLNELKDIQRMLAPKSNGMDATDVDRAVKFMHTIPTERIRTGIKELDAVLQGGYGADELILAMAPPGRGKSFFLLNAMYYAMLSGKNALYVTLELSERAVLRRFYSRVTCSNRNEMMDEVAVARRAQTFFNLTGAKGRVINFPGGTLTVSGLEAVLEQQQFYFGHRTDILIVDYLDRLAPRKTDLRGEVRHQLRNIADDLRSIALKYGIPVISATQANRASLNKKAIISEANVSESFGKVEVADVILAIAQKDDEKARKRANLLVVKNRDAVSGGKIRFYADYERMFMSDVDSASKLGLIESEATETAATAA